MVRLLVQEVAKQKGFSMGRLQRTADISYRTVKLIYQDPYRDVTLSTLEKIANALNVPIRDLIDESSPAPSSDK
jgi:DNA-binding Xre family transcriptional regulator